MTNTDQNAPNSPLRQEYTCERNLYIQLMSEQSKLFDNSILTISSAAIGIGFLLIKDLQFRSSMWLIWVSLVLFVVCIILVLYSFQTSQSWLSQRINNLDRRLENDKELPESEGITDLLNKICWRIFIIAVLLECFFVYVNVGEKMSNEPKPESISKVISNDLNRGLPQFPKQVPPSPSTTTTATTTTPTQNTNSPSSSPQGDTPKK